MKLRLTIFLSILILPLILNATDSYSYLENLVKTMKTPANATKENRDRISKLKKVLKEFISCVRSKKKDVKTAEKVICGAALEASLAKLQGNLKDISTATIANSIQDIAWGNISRTYYDLYLAADGEHLKTAGGEKEFKGPNICTELDGKTGFECSQDLEEKAQAEISGYAIKPSKNNKTGDIINDIAAEIAQVKEETKCENVVINHQTLTDKELTVHTVTNFAISNLNSEDRLGRVGKYLSQNKNLAEVIVASDTRFGLVDQIHSIKQDLVESSKNLIQADTSLEPLQKMEFLLSNFPRAAGQLLATNPSRKLIEELCNDLPKNNENLEAQQPFGDRFVASRNGEILISGCTKDKAGQCIAEATLDNKQQIHSGKSQKICEKIAEEYKKPVSDTELENAKKQFDSLINRINEAGNNTAAFWPSRETDLYQYMLDTSMSEFLLKDCPNNKMAVNGYIKHNYERTARVLDVVRKDPKLANLFWNIKKNMLKQSKNKADIFFANRRLVNFFARLAPINETTAKDKNGFEVKGWKNYLYEILADFGDKDLDDPEVFNSLLNDRIKNIVSDDSLRDQCIH